jgi:hypothetical protein
MSKLTPWFPASVMPVRPGVYEVNAHNRARYRRWDGRHWFVGSSTTKDAASSKYPLFMNAHSWRGLVKPPKGGKK